jgi:hypothetical protein
MKMKLLFLILLSAFCINNISAQNNKKKITITGTVMDVTNQPVANAIIMIDGQKTNSTTDKKGNFKIRVKHNAEKIGIFTSGKKIYEEALNGRTQINLTLSTQVSLKEVNRDNDAKKEEVNVGYGTVEKKNLTNHVGKISAMNKKYATYHSIYDLIRGELPGVRVNGNVIVIQGMNSLTYKSDPLFVVDGIIVSSIDYVQPQMVKSIEVLMGSSASVYGSRGSNGVIMISLIGAGDLN